MPHAIWEGNISFGLVNIPVSLHTAEKKSQNIQFNLLDSRNNSRIRYKRVNEVTGKEVPWDAIVKGYEYEKDQYVLISGDELKNAQHENLKTIEIEDFIANKDLDFFYFEKPYYLLPSKRGEKGYVLLRETLKKTKKVGIAKVMIRSKEYLVAIIPYEDAIIANVLRYPQEIKPISEFDFPAGDLKDFKIAAKEVEIATQLIEAMTIKWNPKHYHDEFHDILMKMIEAKVASEPKKAKGKRKKTEEGETEKPSKVVDFMDVLKESIKERRRRSSMRRPKASSSNKRQTRRKSTAQARARK